MCIALIGGIDRLEKHYHEEAKRAGYSLQVFSQSQNNIAAKLKKADAIVIFTNMVSHRVKAEAMQVAKAHDIPVFMNHACGVCSFRNCIQCLSAKN